MCIVRQCPKCNGSGLTGEGEHALPCLTCNGTGVITIRTLPRVAVSYQGHNDDDGDGEGT